MTTPLDIVGTSEVAEMAGVSKHVVSMWLKREQIVEPDARLRCGPIWRRSTIEKWLDHSDGT